MPIPTNWSLTTVNDHVRVGDHLLLAAEPSPLKTANNLCDSITTLFPHFIYLKSVVFLCVTK